MSLQQLLQRADIWRGGEHSLHRQGSAIATLPSGYPVLDEKLPGGGWPVGAVTELLLTHQGIGELQLLLPALLQLSRAQRTLVWVAPPHIPYAPALAMAGIDLNQLLLIRSGQDSDTLWAMEQSLRSGLCGAVLGWPQKIDPRALRRLQLAAESGQSMALLFRPAQEQRQHSPAALRLYLQAGDSGLQVRILKCRGPRHCGVITLKLA